MPEPSPHEQEVRRLKAEKVGWANMATIANLERDALRAELESARREAEWVRSENQRLWMVVSASESLLSSRTWGNSSLAEMSNGPVARFKESLVRCRAAARDRPLSAKINDPRSD